MNNKRTWKNLYLLHISKPICHSEDEKYYYLLYQYSYLKIIDKETCEIINIINDVKQFNNGLHSLILLKNNDEIYVKTKIENTILLKKLNLEFLIKPKQVLSISEFYFILTEDGMVYKLRNGDIDLFIDRRVEKIFGKYDNLILVTSNNEIIYYMNVCHQPLPLMKKINNNSKIKKIFMLSGIYDYILYENGNLDCRVIASHHNPSYYKNTDDVVYCMGNLVIHQNSKIYINNQLNEKISSIRKKGPFVVYKDKISFITNENEIYEIDLEPIFN